MLPEDIEETQSLASRKLNLQSRYETILILPNTESTSEITIESKSDNTSAPCENFKCNSMNSMDKSHLEEEEKNKNLLNSKIDKELKNQKECIIF